MCDEIRGQDEAKHPDDLYSGDTLIRICFLSLAYCYHLMTGFNYLKIMLKQIKKGGKNSLIT